MTVTPNAPQPPASEAPGTLADAADAARARVDEALPPGRQPGDEPPAAPPADAPAETPAGDADVDLFADDALDGLDLSNLSYQDGKKLEGEIRRARERYRPFNDAFGQMTDEGRQRLLDAAPRLGDDLALVSAASAHLHPNDRAYFAEVMALMATDPEAAAAELARGADILRGAGVADDQQPPGTEWATPPAGDGTDPGDQPITRRDLEAWQAQQSEARAVEGQVQAMLKEATDLGYAPESDDPVEVARFETLISLAGRPSVGGDLAKAHQLLEARDQAIIDRFVAGKSADADRPVAPDTGTAPAPEARPVETLVDAREAMTARLTGALGPDPRARTGE